MASISNGSVLIVIVVVVVLVNHTCIYQTLNLSLNRCVCRFSQRQMSISVWINQIWDSTIDADRSIAKSSHWKQAEFNLIFRGRIFVFVLGCSQTGFQIIGFFNFYFRNFAKCPCGKMDKKNGSPVSREEIVFKAWSQTFFSPVKFIIFTRVRALVKLLCPLRQSLNKDYLLHRLRQSWHFVW